MEKREKLEESGISREVKESNVEGPLFRGTAGGDTGEGIQMEGWGRGQKS